MIHVVTWSAVVGTGIALAVWLAVAVLAFREIVGAWR